MKRCRRRNCSLPASLCAALVLLTGCAGGLEFAAVGAAANAAQAGATVVKRGKIDAAHLAEMQTVVTAAEQAIVDAGLAFEERETRQKNAVELVARDDRRAKYTFRIKRDSPRLVEYQIDVGWFGHDATARLLLRRMQVYLAQHPLEGIKIVPVDDMNGASG